MTSIPAGEIATMLSAQAEAVAAYLVTDGRREGGRWVGHCAAGKVSIDIRQQPGRVFFCHGGGKARNGGDLLNLFCEIYGKRDGLREAKAYLRIDDMPADENARQWASIEADRRHKQRMEDAAAEERRRHEKAVEVWRESNPFMGTPAELYMLNRVKGLEMTGWRTDVLRFHPALLHPSGRRHPALVCRVDGVDGNPIGIWRIFLTEDGLKAPEENVKLGLGPCHGGAVRLIDPADGFLQTCEGVETAAGVWMMTRRPVWPCLTAGGVEALDVPFGISKVRVFPDGDKWKLRNGRWIEPTGERVARAFVNRANKEGIEADMAPVPSPGIDHLDLWNAMYEAKQEETA